MTVRYYCDVCDVQLTRNFISDRIKGKGWVNTPTVGQNVSVEIIAGIGGTVNAGHICETCLRTAILSLFSEPTPTEEASDD